MIAGHGSIALEFLSRFPGIDCLIVPVGGGGLIAGICIAAKHLNPAVEIVGVEAELFPSMRNVLCGEERPSGGRSVAEGGRTSVGEGKRVSVRVGLGGGRQMKKKQNIQRKH